MRFKLILSLVSVFSLLHLYGCSTQPSRISQEDQSIVADRSVQKGVSRQLAPHKLATQGAAIIENSGQSNNYLLTYTHNGANIVAVNGVRLPEFNSQRFSIIKQRIELPPGKHSLHILAMKRYRVNLTHNLFDVDCYEGLINIHAKSGHRYRLITQGSMFEKDAITIIDSGSQEVIESIAGTQIECTDILNILNDLST